MEKTEHYEIYEGSYEQHLDRKKWYEKYSHLLSIDVCSMHSFIYPKFTPAWNNIEELYKYHLQTEYVEAISLREKIIDNANKAGFWPIVRSDRLSFGPNKNRMSPAVHFLCCLLGKKEVGSIMALTSGSEQPQDNLKVNLVFHKQLDKY